jgi:acyl-[acyl-carrier-protein]-phospholipid O-acyltransferase/long-chain-fatty-acid--[acyl-carrier-protein] ligase
LLIHGARVSKFWGIDVKWILRACARAVFRVRLDGQLDAADGPSLFAANHAAAFDSVLLWFFLPRRSVVVLPREDLRSGWVRLALLFIPHLVADMNDPATIKKVMRVLAAGRSVALYPEGRVFDAPSVMKVYEVPALIAAKTGAPVVPVRIRYRRGWPVRVEIRVRAPARISGASQAASRARRARAARELQRLLEAAAYEQRPRTTVFEAFLDAVHERGRRTLIIEDMKEEPRSYRELLKGSLIIGRWMSGWSAPGENVGVLLPNSIPTVCAVLGLCAFGRVPALLNYTAGPTAVQGACAAARVRTVITSRAFIEQARLTGVVSGIADLRLLYLEDMGSQFGLGDKLWLITRALRNPRRVITPGRSSGPAVVVFTSGSEARPKGVVLSHEAILANITQIAAVIDFTPRDKVLNPLPLYHSYSFTAGMMLCLLTGTKLFLYISPLRYRAIPEIASRRDCTYLFGTSTFLSYYAKKADPLDFHSVRRVISGGEKLGADVARAWQEKFGLRIYQGYGATECAPVIALSTPRCFKPGSVGPLLPGLDHRIQKVEGIERGGVLHLKGAQLMLGYYLYENPGVIVPPRSIYGDGWYNTGDVVDVDEDGVLTVVGRVRRFAKIAGEMVSLDIIEEVAREASPAHRHAAVLRAEAASGETTVLFTTDPELNRSALVHCARRLGRPELALSKRILWMPEIPVLASGKTDYVALETITTAANAPEAGPDDSDARSTASG